MAYVGDDYSSDDSFEEYPRRPRYHRSQGQRRSHYGNEHHFLDPYMTAGTGGVRRARSHGHAPPPNIHIYNDMMQEHLQPPPPPDPHHHKRGRSGRRRTSPKEGPAIQVVADDEIVEPPQVVKVGRSRSRTDAPMRVHHGRGSSPYYTDWRDYDEDRNRLQHDAVEDYKRQAESEERRRKDDYERWKFDMEKEREDKKREEKELFEKIKREEKDKAEKKKEEERELYEKMKREEKETAEKKKKEREDLEKQIEIEKKEKKEREKKEEEEFKRKQLLKEAKKKEEEEEEHKKYVEKLTADMAKAGLSRGQIDHVIHAEERKKQQKERYIQAYDERSGMLALPAPGGRRGHSHRHSFSGHGHSNALLPYRPVYPKIRRSDIASETLSYYAVPWEDDPSDDRYIIILEELPEWKTDELFEHTRNLRQRTTLTVEGRPRSGRDPEWAWVKRRSSSRGKSPAARHSKSPHRVRLAEKILGIP